MSAVRRTSHAIGGRPGSGGLEILLQPVQLEGEDDLGDAAEETSEADPEHEQERLAAVLLEARPCGPEAEPELDDPDDELQPPDLDLVPRRDRDDDVERPLENEEERDDARE